MSTYNVIAVRFGEGIEHRSHLTIWYGRYIGRTIVLREDDLNGVTCRPHQLPTMTCIVDDDGVVLANTLIALQLFESAENIGARRVFVAQEDDLVVWNFEIELQILFEGCSIWDGS